MSVNGVKSDRIILTKREMETFPVLCEKLAKKEWDNAKVVSFFRAKIKDDEEFRTTVARFKQYLPVYNEIKLEKLANEYDKLSTHLDALEDRKVLLHQNIQKNEKDVVQIRMQLKDDIIASAHSDRPKVEPR